MRPAPISDELAATMPGERVVIGPPDNELDGPIAPVEAMVEHLREGRAYTMRLILEEGDLDVLAAGGAVQITMLGRVVPFSVRVGL